MRDIIKVILADQERIRRLLRALDDAARYGEDPGANRMLGTVWGRLATSPNCTEADEEICYPALFGQGQAATAQGQAATATTSATR